MPLRFYNTYSQRLEEFQPLDGRKVRMYTCGPTVYHFVHIGNFRTFAFQDVLRRTLRARGYELFDVQQATAHTQRMGASQISRRDYCRRLQRVLQLPVTFGDHLQVDIDSLTRDVQRHA